MTVITANRKSLAAALRAGAVVVEKSGIEVFNNVRLAVSKGSASLTFTNSEMWLGTSLTADADAITATTIPCAQLTGAANAMEGDTLTIDVAEGKAVLKSGRARLTLATAPADQFPLPDWPKLGEDHAVVEAKEFASALASASYAAPDMNINGHLSAVRVECRDGEAWICTYDSTRLAADGATNHGSDGVGFNLPLKAAQVVSRIAAGSDGEIRFASTDRFAIFEIGEWRILARLVEGEFKSFAELLTDRTDFPVMFDPQSMSRALGRLALISDNYSKGVRFDLEHDRLTVSLANSKIGGEASEEVPVGYEGAPQILGFSLPFLRDALRNIDGDDAEMHVFAPVKRALIQRRDGLGSTHIIGPFVV